MNKIIKNQKCLIRFLKKCKNHYNVNSVDGFNQPNQYPCIVIPQLISDINGTKIKFNFVYKKDCQKLLKSL